MGTVYARTASSPTISMPATKLRMRAFRSGKSATYPLISLPGGSSGRRFSQAAGQGAGGKPAELIDTRPARVLDAGHQPSARTAYFNFAAYKLVRIALYLYAPHLNKLEGVNCGPVSQTRVCDTGPGRVIHTDRPVADQQLFRKLPLRRCHRRGRPAKFNRPMSAIFRPHGPL